MDQGTMAFLVFVAIATAFAVGSVFLNRLLGAPRRRSYLQLTTYECGQEPEGEAQIDFPSQHYVYAIVFVAVDILGLVLALWAVSLRGELAQNGLLSDPAPWTSFVLVAAAFTVLALTGIYYVLRSERSLFV